MRSTERVFLFLAAANAVAAWALPDLMGLDVPWSLILYGGGSLLAFLATWLDKRAAVKNRGRWSEKGLHLIELLGGWPGALVAQNLMRHKTVKRSYRFVFWVIVVLHIAAWAWYLSIP